MDVSLQVISALLSWRLCEGLMILVTAGIFKYSAALPDLSQRASRVITLMREN